MSFIAIGLGAMLRGAVSGWWIAYKERHEGNASMAQDRDGTWRPSRVIPRVERLIDWGGNIGLGCLGITAAFLVYDWVT